MQNIHFKMLVRILFCFIGIILALCAAHDTDTSHYNHDVMWSSNCTNVKIIDLTVTNATYGFILPVADSEGGYPNVMDCTTQVVAPPGYFISMRFRSLNIYQPDRDCGPDFVMLSGNTTSYTFCGSRTPSQSFATSGQILQLRFVSNNTLSDNRRIGFEAYYTAFHTLPCDNQGDKAPEFKCYKDRCIPRELTCDHYDNCGEWSDERTSVCGLSTGMIVLISITVCLVVAACVVGAVAAYQSKKKRDTVNQQTVAIADGPVVYKAGVDTAPPLYNVAISPPAYS